MTKMFAGASIMMLVDEGKVSLDDPVTKFIPQLEKWMVVGEKDQSHILLKALVRPVTVRHVLSHTSGLTGSSELQQATGSDSTPLKARALSSVTGPLQWQPGDKYQYGNQGMNIAARIVEIVSEMPYEEFLQKRFFDPLGMTETTFWPSDAQIARLAGAYGPNKEKNGYAKGGLPFLTKPFGDRTHRFPEAGGGLFSTTHDILRYGLMLANDGELDGKRYLSHGAMDELHKEQTGTTKINYSLGYHLRNGMFGHDGAYGTDLSVNPATGMVAIFMVQCTSSNRWAARDLFLKTATKVFQKPKFKILALAEAGGHHIEFTKAAMPWLKTCGDENGFQVDFISNTAAITATFLAQYRLVLQLDFVPYGWTPEAMAAFKAWIEEGRGGWIGLHHATLLGDFDGKPMWPWFSDFMGGIKFKNYIPGFASATV